MLFLAPILAALLGVASSPARPAVRYQRGPRPPAPVAHQVPASLPQPPQPSSAPVLLAAAAAQPSADRISGVDLVSSPNVFRGLSAGSPHFGKIVKPEPLNREDEYELVQRALFFISSTNAERALNERARDARRRAAAHAHASAHHAASGAPGASGVHAAHADELGDDDDEEAVFHSDEIMGEMRAEAEARRWKRFEAARGAVGRAGKAPGETEMPVEVPEDMSDTEFRLTVALGRAAYNKLFHHHQRLVYYEVNKVWPNWMKATVLEKADFLQEGAQGLLRAIRLFDTGRGVRFSTYASWHVRAFVLRALRDKSHIVRLPQLLQQDMQQIRKARYRYAVETHGIAPSESALAEMLSWPPSRVAAALKGLASASATSLDADVFGGGGQQGVEDTMGPMHARFASPKHGSDAAHNEVYRSQLKSTLRDAMAERDPRRIQITRLKYGLEDGVEWTYPMLSQRFNQSTNVLKGIVRTEVNFLRRSKRTVLQEFANHMQDA